MSSRRRRADDREDEDDDKSSSEEGVKDNESSDDEAPQHAVKSAAGPAKNEEDTTASEAVKLEHSRSGDRQGKEQPGRESKKNPTVVPRGGQFFLHDNRQHSSTQGESEEPTRSRYVFVHFLFRNGSR